ncbi:hypothetical protein [Bacillus timonensis]|uniref:hypothetical protein n=1 Tax=Bacillus timonensis TaxID=1033734 RepID=UPI00028A0EC4|nr:hypothetical protein [Bacillus timonensis]
MSGNKFDNAFPNKDTKVQMQQKIIHYRSEVITFQNKLKQAELDLEKEKLRNHYLQEKLYEVENTNLESYEKEIADLKMKLLANEVALEEEKNRVKIMQEKIIQSTQLAKQEEKVEPERLLGLNSFFNYSVIYTPEEDMIEEENHYHHISILGDYLLENFGTAPLHQPIVCIRLSPRNGGYLSGKIATNSILTESQSDGNVPQEEWQYVHEDWKERIKKKGEYWIKPAKAAILQPKEKIHFSNFELTLIKPKEQTSVIIEAFSYCKEFPNGIPSLNKIILNL